MKPILICGAGLAGLALARQLSVHSIPFKIIEKNTNVRAEGAGIALPANAMNLLDYMGLSEKIKTNSYRVRTITYASYNKLLSTASLEEKPLNQNIFLALPRSELHKILLDSLDKEINLSTSIHSITERKDGITVVLNQNGNLIEEEVSAVIGADGIHSTIRKHAFPEHTTNDFNLTTWRWLSEWDVNADMTEPFYMFDRDQLFMVYPVSSRQVFCYAHTVNSAEKNYLRGNSVETLNTLFSHCTHDIIKSMLQQLKNMPEIILGKMESVEIPAFSKGKICLIGDACHACAPTLQQGAALAFEDAIILNKLLLNFSIKDAFRFYSEFRQEKVTSIVSSSNARIRYLSSPDVDINSVYENIKKHGPSNVQGWKEILSAPSLFDELEAFICLKKRFV